MEVFDGISKARDPYRLLYTSNYVIDETATFLPYQAGPRVAVPFLEMNSRIAHLARVTRVGAG